MLQAMLIVEHTAMQGTASPLTKARQMTTQLAQYGRAGTDPAAGIACADFHNDLRRYDFPHLPACARAISSLACRYALDGDSTAFPAGMKRRLEPVFSTRTN